MKTLVHTSHPLADQWQLGLDVGTNSLGWAAFRLDDDDRPDRLLDGGVRLFDWGRHNVTKKSLDSERGQARRARRRLRARAWRRARLATLLADACRVRDPVSPSDPTEVWRLRARAATEPVAPEALAICLMHMARRRGFKSTRLGNDLTITGNRRHDDEDETSRWDTYDGILRRDLADAGLETVGQLFARRLEPGGAGFVRARSGEGVAPSRRLIREEFEIIRKAQESAAPLSAADWETVAGLIFDQRPLGEPTRGRCAEYPDDPRLPKAMPSAQRLMVRQTVANLRLSAPQQLSASRSLDAAEATALVTSLDHGGVHKWGDLRKALRLDKSMRFTIETERASGVSKTAMKQTTGDLATHVLRPLVPGWDGMDLAERDALVADALKQRQDRRALARIAAAHAVPSGSHDAFADAIQFALPRGAIAYGARAVGALLERLKPGTPFHVAVEGAFGHRYGERPVERLSELPDYTSVLPGGRIRNVTVHIALGEIRKLVNALIHRYGPPRRVIIETTRDLKASAERLRKIADEQAAREQRNREDDAEIAQAMAGAAEQAAISRTGRLRRLRLFRRQNKLCPYCAGRLGITAQSSGWSNYFARSILGQVR